MIDNLGLIKPLLNFGDEDTFYFLQILQRKKENPTLGSNSRVIKNYFISNIEYLEKHYDEIRQLCYIFNARASLRLNRRSYSKVAFKTMQNLANTMGNGEFSHVSKSYVRACGQSSNEKSNKTWIIDLDNTPDFTYTDEEINKVADLIRNVYAEYSDDDKDIIVALIPSLNGYHLITNPFNLKIARDMGFDIDVHKDNPTNLYIP